MFVTSNSTDLEVWVLKCFTKNQVIVLKLNISRIMVILVVGLTYTKYMWMELPNNLLKFVYFVA